LIGESLLLAPEPLPVHAYRGEHEDIFMQSSCEEVKITEGRGWKLAASAAQVHGPRDVWHTKTEALMDTTTLLIIVVVLLLFGGGGWGYSRRR